MREYFTSGAKAYQQTEGKKFVLIPAIRRIIPKPKKKNSKLLDIGCGVGDFYTIAHNKGYNYYGLDISPYMIERASKDYPKGNYLVADAMNFSGKYEDKFDVILFCMLFPAFSKRANMAKVLEQSKAVLNKNGTIILGVTHPCFDGYMRKGLFGKKNIAANFKGYFKSGIEFFIHKEFATGKMVFKDFHWTINDYFSVIKKAGLKIYDIDECMPTGKDKLVITRKSIYPTYMVLTCKTVF